MYVYIYILVCISYRFLISSLLRFYFAQGCSISPSSTNGNQVLLCSVMSVVAKSGDVAGTEVGRRFSAGMALGGSGPSIPMGKIERYIEKHGTRDGIKYIYKETVQVLLDGHRC